MNDKRERQRANRMERLEQEARAATKAKRTRLIVRWVIIVASVVGIAFLYSVLSGDGDGSAAGPTTTEASPSQTVLFSSAECPAEDGSSERRTTFENPPRNCIDVEAVYAAEFATSAGTFTALLDPQLDDRSVNNFVVLARYHAYDGTIFHRVIDGFVIQGGDLEDGYGTGGPGYRFTGAYPPEDAVYEVGSLAMANAGDPTSNGSQFFIVTGAAGEALPLNYSLLGAVVDGIDVPLAIGSLATESRTIGGRPVADVPTTDVVIETVTIRLATDDEIATLRSS